MLQSVAMAVNMAGVACSSLVPRPSDTRDCGVWGAEKNVQRCRDGNP